MHVILSETGHLDKVFHDEIGIRELQRRHVRWSNYKSDQYCSPFVQGHA